LLITCTSQVIKVACLHNESGRQRIQEGETSQSLPWSSNNIPTIGAATSAHTHEDMHRPRYADAVRVCTLRQGYASIVVMSIV
jgi:hypothetical protein